MQDSLPAGWLAFTGRASNPLDHNKRFQIAHPPFLDLSWRKGSFMMGPSIKVGELVTSGAYGWTMVVTGTGRTVREASDRANQLADRVIIPNARYRRDIGNRLAAGDLERVIKLGVLEET
jgi:hypothetical protein